VHAQISHADAIVVLSGAATFRERAQHAAMLYHQGRSSKIILTNDMIKSSWSPAKQRNPYYHELAIEELRRAGVPSQDIELIPNPIASTYDEASLLREYCQTHEIKSILVVTSAYHSRRALWTFRHLFRGSGKEVGIDPVDPGSETPAPATWWLHRLGWDMVPNEYLKMAIYRYRY
jgi:uncharacterized SAM-binding protein YcdF (DUF218 family)